MFAKRARSRNFGRNFQHGLGRRPATLRPSNYDHVRHITPSSARVRRPLLFCRWRLTAGRLECSWHTDTPAPGVTEEGISRLPYRYSRPRRISIQADRLSLVDGCGNARRMHGQGQRQSRYCRYDSGIKAKQCGHAISSGRYVGAMPRLAQRFCLCEQRSSCRPVASTTDKGATASGAFGLRLDRILRGRPPWLCRR